MGMCLLSDFNSLILICKNVLNVILYSLFVCLEKVIKLDIMFKILIKLIDNEFVIKKSTTKKLFQMNIIYLHKIGLKKEVRSCTL